MRKTRAEKKYAKKGVIRKKWRKILQKTEKWSFWANQVFNISNIFDVENSGFSTWVFEKVGWIFTFSTKSFQHYQHFRCWKLRKGKKLVFRKKRERMKIQIMQKRKKWGFENAYFVTEHTNCIVIFTNKIVFYKKPVQNPVFAVQA